MSPQKFLDALGQLDDQYIQQAAEYNGKRRKFSRMIGTAAAACLVVLVSAAGIRMLPQRDTSPSLSTGEVYDQTESGTSSFHDGYAQTEHTGGVTIPPLDVYLGNDVAADMIAFFIYQGRCYVQYDTLDEDDGLIGEHLGTAIGLIDEWTPEDGYVDLAGSIGGDFYAVNGYDPEFMLCMKSDNGNLQLYICNNGITLQYGSELYEDRLHLSGNIDAVEFESRASWYNSENERYRLTEDCNEIIETFIHQLDAAEFLLSDQIPLEDGVTSIYETEIYHIYFKMQNGMTVHLRLYQNGYVRFDGMLDVAVQIPETEWQMLLDVLENKTAAQRVQVPDPDEVQLEKCLSDPELGGFIPNWSPDGLELNYAAVSYQIDRETGAETGTRQIMLDYDNPEKLNQHCSITISRTDEKGEYGWTGPVIDRDKLNAETIAKYFPASPDENNQELGVCYGNVIVGCWGRNLDAETVLRIFESVPAKAEENQSS